MDPCTCGPGAGGDRPNLWWITVQRHSGRVLRCSPKPTNMRTDAFLAGALEAEAWYRRMAPGIEVRLARAHSMRCLMERNPEYMFSVLKSA